MTNSDVGPNAETHEIFQPIVEESVEGVAYVAEILRRKFNCEVVVPKMIVSPTVEQRMKYSDKGDMFVNGSKLNGEQCIEVKHLGYDFTGKEDWPHAPHYHVCTTHSFDSRSEKPLSYISLNREATHWGRVIVFSTRKRWYRTNWSKDRNYGDREMPQERYTIRHHLVDFYEIPDDMLLLRAEFFESMS